MESIWIQWFFFILKVLSTLSSSKSNPVASSVFCCRVKIHKPAPLVPVPVLQPAAPDSLGAPPQARAIPETPNNGTPENGKLPILFPYHSHIFRDSSSMGPRGPIVGGPWKSHWLKHQIHVSVCCFRIPWFQQIAPHLKWEHSPPPHCNPTPSMAQQELWVGNKEPPPTCHEICPPPEEIVKTITPFTAAK